MDHESSSTRVPELLELFLVRNSSLVILEWFWSAYSGFWYSRALTVARTRALAASGRPLRVHVSCIGGVVGSTALPRALASTIGKTNIWPDWNSLRLVDETHASIQCQVEENLLLYREIGLEDGMARCPRNCLLRVLETGRREFACDFLAGFELEFYLLDLDDNPQQGDTQSAVLQDLPRTWSAAACMRGPRAKCLEDCMMAIERSGLVVEQGHAESSWQQYEISLGPLPVLEAIDGVLVAAEIIKRVSRLHSFQASFRPLPREGFEPSGLHVHLSLHSTTGRCSEDKRADTRSLSAPVSVDVAKSFLAGMLQRLPALMAFGMPCEESYARIRSPDTMGHFVAWGKTNSTVPVNEQANGHWELRMLDWTANVYLAVAAFITAGLLGIRDKSAVAMQDPKELTHRLSADSREALGIVTRLPTSFEEALTQLIEGQYCGLDAFVGEPVLDLYVAIKQREAEALANMTAEERDQLYHMHY
jgi:glutamine synthetase